MVRRLRKYFLSGLAVFLPLTLAVYVFVWLMNFVEKLLGKYLKPLFLEYYDFYFWGIGILVLVLLILFGGFLITHYFGKVMHRVAEKLVLKVPLLNTIYPAFKEISKFLFRSQKVNIQKVVMVQWPRPGVYVVAFLTNTTSERIARHTGKKLCNVMIPSVPNPLTGFAVMIPEDEITPLDITIEEAVKIIVSGGVINLDEPQELEDTEDADEPAPPRSS